MSTHLSEQTSAEKLEILGRKHAVSHFEKGNFVDSPNEEVQKWLDRNHVMTTQAEFDALHDAYCKGFQSYHVEKWISELTPEQAADLGQRLTPSDPATSPLPVSVAQEASFGVYAAFNCLKSIRRYIDGLAEGPHRTAMVKGWNFMVYGVEGPGTVTLQPDWLKSFTEASSPASSIVPAPLVPEVVKEALETVAKWKLPPSGHFWTHGGEEMSYGAAFGSNGERDYMQEIAESALTALRNYSPEPSPSVELLREAAEALNPFSELWHRSEEFRQEENSSCTWRIEKPDLTRAHAVLSKLNAALA